MRFLTRAINLGHGTSSEPGQTLLRRMGGGIALEIARIQPALVGKIVFMGGTFFRAKFTER